MVSILRDVELEEISLVDRPANQHATVLFFKKDGSSAKALLPADVILKARGDGIITDKEREQRRNAAKARWRRWASNVGLPVDPQISEERVTAKESNRLARTGVILETRGQPTGAAAGAVFGAVGAGYLGYKAMNSRAMQTNLGNKLVRSGSQLGELAGRGIGRTIGAIGQVAGYGAGKLMHQASRRIPIAAKVGNKLFQVVGNAPAFGGKIGGELGRRAGYGSASLIRGGTKVVANVIRSAAGGDRRAALIAGAAAAIPAAYYGSKLGGHFGQGYDLFSYRRVER